MSDHTTQPFGTIAQAVAGLHERMTSEVPTDLLDVFGGERADLAEAGVPPGVAQPGDRLPDVGLLDAQGRSTSLRSAAGGRAAVVVLYRGAWCPYCNLALRAYQEKLVPELQARGMVLVAISPQKPDGSPTPAADDDRGFTVLSDAGNQIATALGVLTAPTEAAQRAQRELGIDVPAANLDGTAGVPMPTVAIVDGSATIRWIDVHPDYATRTEVADIVEAVRRLDA